MDASALYKFSSGLYVVSADDGERPGACIVNTGLQVTSAPLQVSVTVNKENFTCGVIERAGHFSLAVVDESADMLFVGRFGFRTSATEDKFDGIASAVSATGDPYPTEHVCSFVACRVVQTVDVGTHLVFVGEVADAGNLSGVAPMTYAYYHGILKGKTPPKASSYVEGIS
ncbi:MULTISPECIES: flavin reductase family protein [Atopobiaceae]|uniref:flavin reductase family protein n=1 Tax=Atopobiaceae TaxID=1643824 RepID=UPI000B36ABC9|nr:MULTISPECIES: flavin reductase family protein [Atopobiaceae]MCR8907889.1 flavin reductase family protein [Thermophilibacter sp. ET337]OUO32961.1 flavin reductase [Olsenella sp. An293]